MIIDLKFVTVGQSGRDCLKRQLEIDEANMKDYNRPILKMKKTKNPFTFASSYGFAREVIKYMLP